MWRNKNTLGSELKGLWMDIYSSNMTMIVNQFDIDLLGIYQQFLWRLSVDLGKTHEMCKSMCCYVELNGSDFVKWLMDT